MKCVMCDNRKSLKNRKISIKYKDCGLDHVTLQGVDYEKCQKCGEEYFGFGNVEQLHALIAVALISKKELLAGKELRFLRTYLDLSSSHFAERVGIAKETLSRFENNKQVVSKTFDLLVRALVATKIPGHVYNFQDWWLREHRMSYRRIELKAKNNRWKLKLAA